MYDPRYEELAAVKKIRSYSFVKREFYLIYTRQMYRTRAMTQTANSLHLEDSTSWIYGCTESSLGGVVHCSHDYRHVTYLTIPRGKSRDNIPSVAIRDSIIVPIHRARKNHFRIFSRFGGYPNDCESYEYLKKNSFESYSTFRCTFKWKVRSAFVLLSPS